MAIEVYRASRTSRSISPRIDHHGEVLYYIDVDGRRWRVYDTSTGAPNARTPSPTIHHLGSPMAAVRIFVPSDPAAARYAYTFASADRRDITIELLHRQLVSATPIERVLTQHREFRRRPALRRIAV